jgi:hypothetical protein
MVKFRITKETIKGETREELESNIAYFESLQKSFLAKCPNADPQFKKLLKDLIKANKEKLRGMI